MACFKDNQFKGYLRMDAEEKNNFRRAVMICLSRV